MTGKENELLKQLARICSNDTGKIYVVQNKIKILNKLKDDLSFSFFNILPISIVVTDLILSYDFFSKTELKCLELDVLIFSCLLMN